MICHEDLDRDLAAVRAELTEFIREKNGLATPLARGRKVDQHPVAAPHGLKPIRLFHHQRACLRANPGAILRSEAEPWPVRIPAEKD